MFQVVLSGPRADGDPHEAPARQRADAIIQGLRVDAPHSRAHANPPNTTAFASNSID